MSEFQRFNRINRDLITALRQTGNAEWAEARLLVVLQTLVSFHCPNDQLKVINDSLSETLKAELTKILAEA